MGFQPVLFMTGHETNQNTLTGQTTHTALHTSGLIAPCGICGRGDSNPHPLRDAVLSRARLPFRHFRVETRGEV